MPGVFLSYSSKDRAFVRELHRRLTRDDVKCFLDEQSLDPGENFLPNLRNGIAEHEVFMPVLSPDFVQSKWAELEFTWAIELDRQILPLRARECQAPGIAGHIHQFNVTTAELFERYYPAICRKLDAVPQPDLPPADRHALPAVTPIRCPHRMPFRSIDDRFVGRVDALWTVYDQLSQGKTSIVQGVGVVYGTGGLGKTQLAVEYVHRFNLYYPGGVFWIEADQGLSRLIGILSSSAAIEVDGRLPEPQQLETIRTALARRAATLLVLDNFPETGPLTPWLPTSGDIHVLVTTRRRDLTGHRRLTLPYLTADEGQRLLGRFDDDARALVDDIGGLPLALDLLRAWLDTTPGATTSRLRRAMREAGEIPWLEQFAAENEVDLPDGHERSVVATFQLSWDQTTESSRDVLRVMSHLAPAAVPLRLLKAALDCSDDPVERGVKDLWRRSLVECDEQGQPSTHRLILGYVRHLPESAAVWTKTVAAIAKEMNRADDVHDTASYTELESTVPHAEAVLARRDLSDERAVEIATDLRWHHRTLGQFQLASRYGHQALKSAEHAFPHGDPKIAMCQSNLAIAIRDLGELTEARDLLRKALSSDERSYPVGHPAIADKQAALALILSDLEELAEARDLLRKALASDERSYSQSHPNIAMRQSSLAMVLKDLGELAEAQDLLRKALASDERSYPSGHPKIAIRQSNLALVLKDLGELAEARLLLRKALASDQRSYPPGNTRIALRQFNLALVLHDLGEFPEARDLIRKAYDSTLAQFGPNHRRTRTMSKNLALINAAKA